MEGFRSFYRLTKISAEFRIIYDSPERQVAFDSIRLFALQKEELSANSKAELFSTTDNINFLVNDSS